MAQLNPDGSPSKALDDLRKRKIRARPDKGQITPNFHLNEFRTKDARGSAVPVSSWPAIIRLCKDYLEPMRRKFGACTIVSGYRHRAYNNMIPGAAANSQHIYDETPDSVAADARFATGDSKQWVAHAKTLRAGLANKGGIGRYDRDRFVHIDNRPSSGDWQGN
jgi:hypothetical protein